MEDLLRRNLLMLNKYTTEKVMKDHFFIIVEMFTLLLG